MRIGVGVATAIRWHARFRTGGVVAFTATPADLAAEPERTTAERGEALRFAGTADEPINRPRVRVRHHVAAQAGAPPGVFTLTVPTGGGKALTPLHFALDPARANGLDRVLVIIPFAGAWIETASRETDQTRRQIAPSRGRGPKEEQDEPQTQPSTSISCLRDPALVSQKGYSEWSVRRVATSERRDPARRRP